MSSMKLKMAAWYQRLWSQPAYNSLDTPSSDEELESETTHDDDLSRRPKKAWLSRFSASKLALGGFLCLTAGLALGYLARGAVPQRLSEDNAKESADYCEITPSRKEWSTLSFFEKSEFIRAVRCMAYEPSKARPKGALFDDFSYIRAEFGWRSMS